jgi:hypothetical protein
MFLQITAFCAQCGRKRVIALKKTQISFFLSRSEIHSIVCTEGELPSIVTNPSKIFGLYMNYREFSGKPSKEH